MGDNTDVPVCSFANIVKIIVNIFKCAYLIFAAIFVCYGFYNTIVKIQQHSIGIKYGVQVVPKIKFPSVTFCHKYKHGGKNALLTYTHQLFEKWKKSGKICHI